MTDAEKMQEAKSEWLSEDPDHSSISMRAGFESGFYAALKYARQEGWTVIEKDGYPAKLMDFQQKIKPYVLVCDEKGHMAVAYPMQTTSGIRFVSAQAIGIVYAWRPLPPPCTREGE